MLGLEVCVSAATHHLEYGMDPKVKKELLWLNYFKDAYNVEEVLYEVHSKYVRTVNSLTCKSHLNESY